MALKKNGSCNFMQGLIFHEIGFVVRRDKPA
jgi:hypothetical protein